MKIQRVWFLLFLFFLLASLWAVRQYQGFVCQPLHIDKPLVVEVKQGDTVQSLLKQWQQQKLITNGIWSKFLFRIRPALAEIKTGTYQILPHTSIEHALFQISNGKEMQFALTLVEGQRWQDWQAQLRGSPNLTATTLTTDQIAAALGIKDGHLEGRLLPDTYWYTNHTAMITVLRQAYISMQHYLAEAWADRQPFLPLKSPYQALILASIVEKETALATERPEIAAVFLNRLEKGMRLQTDPTVIYGLGHSFDGNLTRADLRQKTPYNTYKIKGLPPTPIAMPSKASIMAVLHPADSDELYFVARGDGSHKFSRTLEEHNAAVRKYQLNQSGS